MLVCSPEALFRYQVVSLVQSKLVGGAELVGAVEEAAELEHPLLTGAGTRKVSARSIYRWLEAFNDQGIAGLENRARQAGGEISSVLPTRFIQFAVKEKLADPRVSIPEIIRRTRQHGILKPQDLIDRTTVYRTLKKLGVSVAHRRKQGDRDSRRFAYAHRMDMVLSDGKHFRAGAARPRRVAMFFLDDATRFPLHAVVGTSESAELFQRGAYEMILKYGLPSAVYVDRGSGFIAEDTIQVFVNLGRSLIHGEKAYPQGRGKLERFHRTATADLLRGFDGRADVDPDPTALELRLLHYLQGQYSHRPHESLRGATPYERFHTDPKPLRFPEDREALRNQFEVYLERRVSSDHVVQVDSVPYEMPRGYQGLKVILHRRLLDGGRIFFPHQGRFIELHPVDLEANARARRAKRGPVEQAEPPLPKSAADLAYERDFGPVVDPDGGFSHPDPKETP